jgi:putative tryptophan/tyrosine transport system substrate-binding protein
MDRRKLLLALGCAMTAASAVRAQQKAMPVIGFLNGGSPDGLKRYLAAFRQGFQQAGYIAGQNVAIEYRWAEGRYDRLPMQVADLVQLQPTVIAATSTPAALAAKAATTTVPIIFTTAGDPVELGLVAALNRPGGNVTGVTQLNVEVAPKRLELAHELLPAASMIPVLVNPTDPNTDPLSRRLAVAARTLGLALRILNATIEREIDEAFATVAQLRAGALVIGTDVFFNSRSEQLGALTLRYAIPTIYQYREFTEAGGLISYGGSIIDSYRIAGTYTGRILAGAKPAELPVQQSTRVELIVNLKTANALGLTVPPSILARADEVIE